jgi:putative nucleotidyltransferase with HDIG domain
MVAETRAELPEEQKPSPRADRPDRWPLWLFVGTVTLLGAVIVNRALLELAQLTLTPGMGLLAVITVGAGRFRIKVPGHSATVSVSEVFVFASILLYGPAVAILIVAIDGLWISLNQSRRRVYRALFNVAEPAVSTGLAGLAFFALYAAPPFGLPSTGPAALMLPTITMAVVYFSLNSTLTAVAVALESNGSALRIWRGHALYLAMNYYAAASIAALVVKGESGLNFGIAGLIAPLVVLSYGAYKASASRMQDANRHLNEVERLYHATVETLAIAVDAKDQVTHGHIRRVQRHTVAVARALGITDDIEIRALEAASLLHDVGKLAVPDYVLNKPGALTHAEFERIKLHATKGAEILSTVEFPYAVVPVVRHHHEQWNGKGYPDGLAGEDIPFGARILTVVDCFDAVTSDRPYRRKMSDEEGVNVLLSRRGTMYDPRVVDAFVQLIPRLRHADRLAEGGRAPHAGPDPLEQAIPVVRQEPELSKSIGTNAFPALCGRLIRERLSSMPGAEACVFAIAPGGDVLRAVYATPAVPAAVPAHRIIDRQRRAGVGAGKRRTKPH